MQTPDLGVQGVNNFASGLQHQNTPPISGWRKVVSTTWTHSARVQHDPCYRAFGARSIRAESRLPAMELSVRPRLFTGEYTA